MTKSVGLRFRLGRQHLDVSVEPTSVPQKILTVRFAVQLPSAREVLRDAADRLPQELRGRPEGHQADGQHQHGAGEQGREVEG